MEQPEEPPLEHRRAGLGHALQLQQLQHTIRELLARLGGHGHGHAEPAYFMTVLERMTMFENYFAGDQRRELEEQRARLGKEATDDSRS